MNICGTGRDVVSKTAVMETLRKFGRRMEFTSALILEELRKNKCVTKLKTAT